MLLLAIGLVGCRKKQEPPSIQTPAHAPAKLLLESAPDATATPNPGAASPPVSAAPAAEGQREGGLPSQQVLYDAIQKYIAEHQGRAAKDVDELVSRGYLPKLPPPPSGKKYLLNQRFATLDLVDK